MFSGSKINAPASLRSLSLRCSSASLAPYSARGKGSLSMTAEVAFIPRLPFARGAGRPSLPANGIEQKMQIFADQITRGYIPRAVMNIRQIEIFRAVASSLSVTTAARRLGISQPAVSKYLRLLSEELGFALYRRQGGRIVLTPEG